MEDFLSLAGFDPRLMRRLRPTERSTFGRLSVMALVSCALAGASISYGAFLAGVGPNSTIAVGLFAALFVFNLARLQNAGGGRPIQGEWDDIDTWRPSLWPILVLLVLGFLLMQGLSLLTVRPLLLAKLPEHLHENGLMAHAHEAWRHPELLAPVSFFWALAFAAFSWLRFFGLQSVRAYERQRWALGRAIVDRLTNNADAVIVQTLSGEPGFSGKLQRHFANPPYNTHRILFGVDEGQVEKAGLRFVPPSRHDAKPWPATPRRGMPLSKSTPAED